MTFGLREAVFGVSDDGSDAFDFGSAVFGRLMSGRARCAKGIDGRLTTGWNQHNKFQSQNLEAALPNDWLLLPSVNR